MKTKHVSSLAFVIGVLLPLCAWAGDAPVVDEIVFSSDTPLTTDTIALSVNAVSPVGRQLQYLWDFQDGTQARTPAVTHVFPTEGVYLVTVQVLDLVNQPVTRGLLVESIAAPPPAAPVAPSVGEHAINPITGGGIGITTNAGGVLGFDINDTNLIPRAADHAFLVDFDDPDDPFSRGAPTASHVMHKFRKAGIRVVTAHIISRASGSELAKVRKTVVISAEDISFQTMPRAAARDTIIPPPAANRTLSVVKGSGKFNFNGTKIDSVTVSWTLELAAGLDLTQNQDVQLSVGNIRTTVRIDPKGKSLGFVQSDGTLNPKDADYKSVKIKWPKVAKGQLTPAGLRATATAQLSNAGLSASGFDTEGVSGANRGTDGKPIAPSISIQMGMLVGGVAYDVQTSATFKIDKKGEVGTVGFTRGQ